MDGSGPGSNLPSIRLNLEGIDDGVELGVDGRYLIAALTLRLL